MHPVDSVSAILAAAITVSSMFALAYWAATRQLTVKRSVYVALAVFGGLFLMGLARAVLAYAVVLR